LDEEALEGLVTDVSASILRLADRGALRPGLRADLLVLPAEAPLRDATRSNVRLVMTGGIARYGDAEYIACAAASAEWTAVAVDGVPKMLDGSLCKLLARVSTREPGLEMARLTGRAA
jgi:cytosine/adenosine deaminase-related metal-dependent hydrolase